MIQKNNTQEEMSILPPVYFEFVQMYLNFYIILTRFSTRVISKFSFTRNYGPDARPEEVSLLSGNVRLEPVTMHERVYTLRTILAIDYIDNASFASITNSDMIVNINGSPGSKYPPLGSTKQGGQPRRGENGTFETGAGPGVEGPTPLSTISTRGLSFTIFNPDFESLFRSFSGRVIFPLSVTNTNQYRKFKLLKILKRTVRTPLKLIQIEQIAYKV